MHTHTQDFHQYYRCVHSLTYAISVLGESIIPDSENIRLVSSRAGRGRPATALNRYGVPYLRVDSRRRRRLENLD